MTHRIAFRHLLFAYDWMPPEIEARLTIERPWQRMIGGRHSVQPDIVKHCCFDDCIDVRCREPKSACQMRRERSHQMRVRLSVLFEGIDSIGESVDYVFASLTLGALHASSWGVGSA